MRKYGKLDLQYITESAFHTTKMPLLKLLLVIARSLTALWQSLSRVNQGSGIASLCLRWLSILVIYRCSR